MRSRQRNRFNAPANIRIMVVGDYCHTQWFEHHHDVFQEKLSDTSVEREVTCSMVVIATTITMNYDR